MNQRLVARTATARVGDLAGTLPAREGTLWVRRGEGLAGRGAAARVDVGTGTDRFRRAAVQLDELFTSTEVHGDLGVPGSGPVAFASFTFDPSSHGSVVVVPSVVTGRRDDRSWRTVVGAGTAAGGTGPPANSEHSRTQAEDDDVGPGRRIRYAGSSLPDVRWLESVATALERIAAGTFDKVVLARDQVVWSHTPFDPRVLARRLAVAYPDCYTFCVDGLVGATPELLVRRMGPAVSSLVLAGTARRSPDPAEDGAIGELLLTSGKDRSEHAFAVTSVAEVLDERCDDLAVDPEPFLLRLANVQHLATRVRGTLRRAALPTALELAGALHPTAAVCGTPTSTAAEQIRELEGMDRGRYAGPVGWVDASGDGEFGIALRCAQLAGPRARLFAGNGIVAGSLPETELEETRLKLRAMQSAFEGPAGGQHGPGPS